MGTATRCAGPIKATTSPVRRATGRLCVYRRADSRRCSRDAAGGGKQKAKDQGLVEQAQTTRRYAYHGSLYGDLVVAVLSVTY